MNLPGSSLFETDARRPAWVLRLVLLAVLAVLVPPDGILSYNEEHFFAEATKWLHPDRPAADSAVSGGRGYLLVFMAPVSLLIDALGYETTQMIGRALVVLAYALTLSRLFLQLRIGPLGAIAVLAVFMLLEQQILGGEWLFLAFNAKALAYPLVLFALGDLLIGRRRRPMLALALACWLHFLIGGFWFALVMIWQLLQGRSIRQLLAQAAWFLVPAAPLAWLILHQYAGVIAPGQAGANPAATWIYSYFRNPHHVAPFATRWQFLGWLPGMLALVPMLLASLWLLPRTRGATRSLAQWVVLLLLYLSAAVLASALAAVFGLDHRLGPLFPFRPGSLVLLLWLTLVWSWLAAEPTRLWQRWPGTAILVSVTSVLWLAIEASAIRADARHRGGLLEQQAGLYRFVREHTAGQARFLIAPALETRFFAFERRAGRPVLVLWKFVSLGPGGIQRWYRRELFKRELFTEGCRAGPYRIDYLVVEARGEYPQLAGCTETVYSDARYRLLALHPPR